MTFEEIMELIAGIETMDDVAEVLDRLEEELDLSDKDDEEIVVLQARVADALFSKELSLRGLV